MTTGKTGQEKSREEKSAAKNCCSPQRFAEMMAKFGDDMNCQCGAMMQKMMKDEGSQSEEK